MESFDIRADISRRVAAAIEAEHGLGVEKFGHSVAMAVMLNPQGQDQIIWLILITCRSPLLGQPDIGSTSKFQGNTVQDTLLLPAVRKSVTLLREEFQRVLAAGIAPPKGHIPAAFQKRGQN